MIVQVEGLVVRGFRMTESSKVVILYTRDHGKVRLVAKVLALGCSMTTFPFTDRTTTDSGEWFDLEKQSGLLSNYLLDPQEFFVDGVTSRLTETLVTIRFFCL